jgi:hypothetical protein
MHRASGVTHRASGVTHRASGVTPAAARNAPQGTAFEGKSGVSVGRKAPAEFAADSRKWSP